MGQGPVGDAVAHAAGQGAAGPWRSSTLAGSNEEVEGAQSTAKRDLALGRPPRARAKQRRRAGRRWLGAELRRAGRRGGKARDLGGGEDRERRRWPGLDGSGRRLDLAVIGAPGRPGCSCPTEKTGRAGEVREMGRRGRMKERARRGPACGGCLVSGRRRMVTETRRSCASRGGARHMGSGARSWLTSAAGKEGVRKQGAPGRQRRRHGFGAAPGGNQP